MSTSPLDICFAQGSPLSLHTMAWSAICVAMLSAFLRPLTSFVLTPAQLAHRRSLAYPGSDGGCGGRAMSPRDRRGGQPSRVAPAAGGVAPSCSSSTGPLRFPFDAASCSFSMGPLRIGFGDCPSDDECEIVYDADDEDEEPSVVEKAAAAVLAGVNGSEDRSSGAGERISDGDGDGDNDSDSNSTSDMDSKGDSDGRREDGRGGWGDGGLREPTAVAAAALGAEGLCTDEQPAAAEGGQDESVDPASGREGLEHRNKVLDDGYEKQGMVKWREAEVVENKSASADDPTQPTFHFFHGCRLLTLSLVRLEGLEHDFSRATWLDNYKVPGQFVGIRLDDGGDGGVAGCLVAVSTEPLSVRQNGGKVQVLVTEEPSFRLKGDTRGLAKEAEGRSLAALEPGDKVKMSDFMGRGFASLFVGWIGLQSALQEQRDIVIVASGARGLGSVKPVLDWPPVQAHAGVKKVSVFLEAESPDTAPILDDLCGWRSWGIRVTQCFSEKTNEHPVDVESAIFYGGAGLAGAVGGDPAAASFLMAGLPGKRAMELTDRLTEHGVQPERLLFNEIF